ncbi:hypothetical protein [Cupriavidus agavae]|uniref:hypothetical protein n=1 Tax=Cupriavidus agavae TaxID=1001822 RepID=UPI00102C7B54|nr:hypothetical protein [Cupriavidus agavae]
MKSNKNMIFSLAFTLVVASGMIYSCVTGPTLGDVRNFRKMMRADMSILIKEVREIVDYDDDRKKKTMSVILSLKTAPEFWKTDHSSNYISLLGSIGWIPSIQSNGIVFMCKNGVSASIINPDGKENYNGFISMSYPPDRRARCHMKEMHIIVENPAS